MKDLSREEIDAIVVTKASYENMTTGETVVNPTMEHVIEQMLARDIAQITMAFALLVNALKSRDIHMAGAIVMETFNHIDETTGPTITACVEALIEYTERREQMGEVEIPDTLPDDLDFLTRPRLPSQRH